MKKTFIVLGTARSGTSMIAGVLHKLGVNMNPIDLGHADNPDFVGLSSRITQDIRDGIIHREENRVK